MNQIIDIIIKSILNIKMIMLIMKISSWMFKICWIKKKLILIIIKVIKILLMLKSNILMKNNKLSKK